MNKQEKNRSFINLRMRDRLAKAVSFVLVAALILTSMDLSVLAASKDGTDNGQGTITEIRTLSEDILQQYVEVGAEESDIDFPENLNVTVSYEKEVEKATESDSVIEKIENDSETETEKQTEDKSTEDKTDNSEETTEQTDDDKETSETTEEQQATETTENQPTTDTSEPAGGENSEDENNTPDADEVTPSEPTETAENNAETIVSRVMDAIFPAMTVYAAEKEDVATPSDAQEGSATDGDKSGTEENIDSEPATKTVTEKRSVSVTWVLNTEKSSADTFSSEKAGDVFYYDAELSEEYNLADDVELPEIKVTIGTKSEELAFNKSQTVDGVKVTVLADEGVFPEGATLSVSKVDTVTEEKVTDNVDAARDENTNVAKSYTFDIKVLDKDGNEIQPDTTKGQVKVSFALAEVTNDNLDVDVYHISDEILADDNKSAEKLDSNVEKVEGTEAVVAETTGFSYYTVEFTYNNLQYVMNGDSKIALADILAEVGLTGAVSNAVSSNPELFSVAKEDGKWMVSAKESFGTKETLTVTINGIEYKIAVTDPVDGSTVFGTLRTNKDGVNYYKLTTGTYNLTADTTIQGYLLIDKDNVVTINLNGHTLKRTDTTSAKKNGCVILLGGKLTINGADSEGNRGTITGGYGEASGGCICLMTGTVSEVAIYNTIIDGCRTSGSAGAIDVIKAYLDNVLIQNCKAGTYYSALAAESGGATLKDTTIINCTSNSNKGGGAIGLNGPLTLIGKVVIKDNTSSGTKNYAQDNIQTDDDSEIDASQLTDGSYIGIYHSNSYAVDNMNEGILVTNLGSKTADINRVAAYFHLDAPSGFGKKIDNTNKLYMRNHTHTWSYSAEDNVITATCAENNPSGVACGAGKVQTLTLDASKCGKTYDGSAITAPTITASTGWTTANSLPAKPSIYYKGVGDTTYNSSTARPTNAGTYQASITVNGATATAKFEIKEASSSFNAPSTLTKTYGDAAFDISVTDKVGIRAISYASSDTNVAEIKDGKIVIKNAGTTTITVSAEKEANYTKAADKTVALTVSPKNLTNSMIVLSLSEPEYTGNAQTQTVTVSDKVGSTELITADDYDISGDALTQSTVGTYKVKVTGKKNYTGEITKTWKIKGKDFSAGDIVATPYTGTYDGQEHGITVSNPTNIAGFKVLYSDAKDGEYSETSPANKKTDAGTYTVWYKVTATGYNELAPASATITINKANAVVTPDADQSKVYGDIEPTYAFTATGLVNGEDKSVLGVTLKRDSGENVGEYAFALDKVNAANYNVTLASDYPKFKITPKSITADMVVLDSTDKTYVHTGSAIAPMVTVTDRAVLTKDTDYTLGGKQSATDFGSYELEVTGKGNYKDTVKVTWKISDPNPPTGTITVAENSWNTFWNGVTFGHFFKETQTVTITGQDRAGESGLDKIFYKTSETVLTEAQVRALADNDWTNLSINASGSGSFDIDPDKKLVIYAKIVDKSGNTTYISSEGIVLDATAPTITGVTDGQGYCTLQTITVSDMNLDKVTVDNTEITLNTDGAYQLFHKDTAQVIKATDKAGNVTTVTVTVHSDHAFGEWIVDKAATADKEGKRHRECSVCHQKQFESIPKTGETENGNVTKEAVVEPGAPDTTLNTSKADLIAASGILTDEERNDIQNNGVSAKIWLEVAPLSESDVPTDAKTKIDAKATELVGGKDNITYFDLTLWKQLSNQASASQIHEPGTDISVTITIPESIRNTDSSKIRTYYVFRVHGTGECEIIGQGNANSDYEFTFTTDKFSTYAIAYKDTNKPSSGGGSGSGDGSGSGSGGGSGSGSGSDNNSNNNNSNTNPGNDNTNTNPANTNPDNNTNPTNNTDPDKKNTSPKTGDDFDARTWIYLVMLGLAGMGGTFLYRKKKKGEEQ